MQDFQNLTRSKRSAARRWLLGLLALSAVAVVAASAVALGAVPAARSALGLAGEPAPRVDTVSAATSGIEGSSEPVASTTGETEGTSQPETTATAAAPVVEPMNILILGVDKRPNGDVEGLGTRSDTIMLAHVEPATGEVQIVSVPRDLYIEITPGQQDKVNAAYAYNGVEGTVAALQSYGDIAIDHYAVVDFNAFRTVVNEMGGLQVDVQEEIPEIGLEPGLQTLKGNKALLYARYRGTEGGDLDRIRRQQQVVAALRGQALRWESLSKLPVFAGIVAERVQTDVSVEEGVALGQAMLQNDEDGTMTATQLTGSPETLDDGTQVLIPNDEENERILAPFRY